MTDIPPMPVTTGSHTLATSATAPTRKTMSEDITWVEVEARPPSPVPTTEEEMEESSNNNQLGESYVADVQHSGSKAPFHCTDVMTCEHLKNHFNKCLNDKINNTFKDLFSNINIDSIQETYPNISIYNSIIVQFVVLEASEVGLWAKTFQIAGHC